MAELLTLARPYAKAVFSHGHEQDCLARWSTQLQFLATLANEPRVRELEERPGLSREQVAQHYLDVAEGLLDQPAVNFVRLLAENRRLALLPEIASLFEKHKAQAEQKVAVEVTAAFEMTEAHQQQFVTALKKKLGKEIELHCAQDATLLAGAVVRVGDQVIDGSLRGNLSQIAEDLSS